MTLDLTQATLDALYAQSFGRVAGYLPKNRQAVTAWLTGIAQQAQDRKEELSPAVAALKQALEGDQGVQRTFTGALGQLPAQLQPFAGIDHMLRCVDQVVTTSPEYNPNPDERILFPLSALFSQVALSPAGQALLRLPAFNTALRNALKQWCAFLDSPQSCSVLTANDNGWLSAQAAEQNKLNDYVIPDRNADHWGFVSFNDYFHRKIKPEARPVDTDPRAVLSANDGRIVRVERNVGKGLGLSLKGQPIALGDILNHAPYADRFTGGDLIQSVLPSTGYHRWHAPVDGVVRHVEIVPGQVLSVPELPAVPLPAGGRFSLDGELATHTRGLIFIETASGMVCVVPVGISEISSVTITVTEGQTVKKGDELGFFSYGGSSMCLLFEPGTVGDIDASQNGTVPVRSRIGRAR